MKLVFTQDIQRDIDNWQASINRKSYGVEWKKFLPAGISEDGVNNESMLKKYLEDNFYRTGKISSFVDWLNKTARVNQIQEDLEKLLGNTFSQNTITAYITTFHRAPYDVQQKFFFLIFRETNRERNITNIYHELMHFLFHEYYWEQCRTVGFNDQQIHVLKESSTILLNPTLEKRGFPKDFGYPNHQELREKMLKDWEKYKNFEKVLDVACEYVKKNKMFL